ncbi:MAG TPA: hypothetical protein VE270_03755 [Thermoleophilaceae bacterium]|jgi:hypothetical protein|nr:hypothetical protein [Thermoleophilaceae bacterium]
MEKETASQWTRRANRVTSAWRAVGGRLIVDGRKLRFEPHGFDRALAADDWSVDLGEIDRVEVAPRRPLSHVFGAGFRRQLCVEAGEEKTFFVVNRAEDVVSELQAMLDAGST